MRELVLLAAIALSGCTNVPEPESYQVMSFDAASSEWIVIHRTMVNGESMTRRLTLQCISSVPSFWDDQRTRYGSNACHLEVGRKMVPTRAARPTAPNDDGKPFLAITADYFPVLIISERTRSTEKVHDWAEQHFSILKDEVVDHP
jgi:hypothetical protein